MDRSGEVQGKKPTLAVFNSTPSHSERMFNYVGNTPSNVQFYLTDSVSNFLAGSLFFKTEPNYDSLLPYINYINVDLKKLIESFEWNK